MLPQLRNKLFILLGVILLGAAFIAPTFSPDLVSKNWISRPIALGLDLSGGVHLVYEVQTKEAVKTHLQNLGNTIRGELRKEKVGVTKVKANSDLTLDLFLLSDRTLDQARKFIEETYRTELTFLERRDEEGRISIRFAFSPTRAQAIESGAVTQAVEKLRIRVDQFGVAEPLIQTAGDKRIILQMPGISDIEAVKRVVGSVAKLEFRLLPLPTGTAETIKLKSREATGTVEVEDEVLMSGDSVQTAQVAFPQGTFEVMLTLTGDGGKRFSKLTRENVNRQLAIILDGMVYSSPVIKEHIPNGQANISGTFSETEARELAVVLRSGALPAPLTVLEERTVGPSLGRESIEAGVMAILGGFALIVVFMSVYYKKSGLVADLSLALNLFLCLAALAAFGATLTLPGLAGLALTAGMAVDSNVLIFERIRDEIKGGLGRDAAVEMGFKQAFTAIIDSNLTTLLTAMVLYFLGTGPIRGFAVTLSIGIASTLFCATFVSKFLFELFELKGKENGLSI